MRNPPWSRDELILALDLYQTIYPKKPSGKSPESKELSDVLRSLPQNKPHINNDKFRTPGAVAYKLSNISTIDPRRDGEGHPNGSKMDKVVWQEFSDFPSKLAQEKTRVLAKIKSGQIAEPEPTYHLLSAPNFVIEELHPKLFEFFTDSSTATEKARLSLPILIRQARAERPITYGDLASEVEYSDRSIRLSLLLIGEALNELSAIHEELNTIPPLQFLVVQKSSGLPGDGILPFVPNAEQYSNASRQQKRVLLEPIMSNIYRYSRWDKVLDSLNLTSENSRLTVQPFKPRQGQSRGKGEGEDHKQLKQFVADNPFILKLPKSIQSGVTEFELLSGDSVDVCFSNESIIIGVEIKPPKAPVSDIQRGLFQCVKYQKVMEAEQLVNGKIKEVNTFLVLGGKFPQALWSIRNTLGIKVVENIWEKLKETY